MNWNTIYLILCSIGAIQSFFLGGYFISSFKGKKGVSNLLLGFMLLAVGLRVAKSTLWLYYREVSDTILNIGFAAHLAIVPLLFLYILSHREKFKWRWYYSLHFLPAVGVAGLSGVLNTYNFWYIGGYSALLYHSVGYLMLSIIFLIKDYAIKPPKLKAWLATLFIAVTVFCMAYFLNYELRLTSYVTGPVVYSGIIYFISFYVLKNHAFFTEERKAKYKNIQLDDSQIKDYKKKVKRIVEDEQHYLEPDFTLTQLSEKSRIPKHILSNLFNVHLKQSFTDYTNSFRVQRAIVLLNNPEYENIKISVVAYESGFNTLSAFNAAFKKITNATPSDFRKRLTENA